MLFAPSGKGQKRQKKGEKGRFRAISRKGGQTPLKPPFVTPPFAAAQKKFIFLPLIITGDSFSWYRGVFLGSSRCQGPKKHARFDPRKKMI